MKFPVPCLMFKALMSTIRRVSSKSFMKLMKISYVDVTVNPSRIVQMSVALSTDVETPESRPVSFVSFEISIF